MANVDTLKAFETLTAAEMPEKQARALVAIVHELPEARLAEVATKNDLKELEVKIERVKFDLLKWLIPFLIGQIALTIGVLIKLLP
jgi:hypothetical protein